MKDQNDMLIYQKKKNHKGKDAGWPSAMFSNGCVGHGVMNCDEDVLSVEIFKVC